jgi:Domain of unknown function (DUF4157)
MILAKLQKPKGGSFAPAANQRGLRRAIRQSAVTFPIVQAKLRIGAPNDRFEQEADRVAERVMHMPDAGDAPALLAGFAGDVVQRECGACSSGGHLCPECAKKEEKLRRKSTDSQTAQARGKPGSVPRLTPGVEARIGGLEEGGQPLPESERGYFERRFRADFSRVRVHNGAAAAAAAQMVNALAFTMGSDIVFAQGQYAPETSSGRRLLAHELAHVIQGGGSPQPGGEKTLRRQQPPSTQTPLQKLDADLASYWTLDSTLLSDLAALSGTEKAKVLTGTGYRDQVIGRLDKNELRTALTTLGADDPTWRDWLKAAGVTLFEVIPGSDFNWTTPDGTLDAELVKRMMKMCSYLILNDRVTGNILWNQGARSKKVAHIKSTAYHVIKKRVTLKDLHTLLAPAKKPKKGPKIYTAQPGDSLSLIAGYPNPGWQNRLAQLIAANPDHPNIKNRTPNDPRYGWLETGDVINIPWETGQERNVPDPTAPQEVRDLDGNLWYVAGWTQAETDAQARKNRGLKPGDDPTLAYEGYKITEPQRLPNSLDPTHPPLSSHIFGLAIDADIPWSENLREKKLGRRGPKIDPWADSVVETIKSFQLQRPIGKSNNPYGADESEPWHFEKL